MTAEEIFIEKAELFSILMDIKSKKANKDAPEIAQIITNYGSNIKNIIDIMCGNGRLALELARRGYRVVGIDFSPFFIERAQKLARAYNLHEKTKFFVADVRCMDFFSWQEKFDIALLAWTPIGYYDYETDLEILSNIRNIVKDKGLLIIYDQIIKERIEILPVEYFTINDYHIYASTKVSDRSLVRKWTFFKRDEKNKIKFVDEIVLKLNVYTVKDITEMIRAAGWYIERKIVKNNTLSIICKK